MAYVFKKGQELADRILDAVIRVLDVVRALPKRDSIAKHVSAQLVRAVTSVGANYEEGRAGESRNDFVHKLAISTKECRESIYWLQIIARARLTTRPLDALIDELSQIAAILSASCDTARR